MKDNQNDKKKKEEEERRLALKEEDDRKLALDKIYVQASEFDRHYDRMSWTILTIVTSAMVATTVFMGSNAGGETSKPPFNNSGFLTLVFIATFAVYISFLYIVYTLGKRQEERTRPIIEQMYVHSKLPPPKGRKWKEIWEIKSSWIIPFLLLGIFLGIYWVKLILGSIP